MMRRVDEYMEVNRANWDQRAPAHAKSPEYNLPRFIDDSAFIGEVVQFDRALLGDVSGLKGVHLQCHIGTDTIGLSRLGARMTGLDFSPAAIEQARTLVAKSGDDTRCSGRSPTPARMAFSLLIIRTSSETSPAYGKTAARTSRQMLGSRPTRPMSGTMAWARS